MRSYGTFLAFALICIGACNESLPTSPSRKPSVPALQVNCAATPAFQCTASLSGRDVTSEAVWYAADSYRAALAVPFIAPSAAVEFLSPGVPRVVRPQIVYILAVLSTRSIACHAYALEATGTAVPLAYVHGSLRRIDPQGYTYLDGVTIEIIEGEGAGKRDTTRNGSYMIEFLRLNRPFTVRASLPGYSPQVKTHPGIVDNSSSGCPTNNYLHFELIRE